MSRHKLNALQRQALEYEDLIFTEKQIATIKEQKARANEEEAKRLRQKREREKNFPDIGSW